MFERKNILLKKNINYKFKNFSLMPSRSKKNISKANISKKKISISNNFKKLNYSSIIKKKNNLTQPKNSILKKTSFPKKNISNFKSSSLNKQRSRSRDKSFDAEKKNSKRNDDLKINNINNSQKNKIKFKKNLNSNKKPKKEEKKEKEEKEYFPEEKFSSEEEEKFDDEESIKSFSEVRLEYLPCRKEEQDIIYNYIKKGLQTNGNYNSLYIAGMPGTGKTASVKTIINILESELNEALKSKKNNKELIKSGIIPFKKLFISGIEFPNISNVFKTIYNFIFAKEKSYTINKYIQMLDNFFLYRNKYNSNISLNDPSNSHIILIIDEIDILINYTQNLLYNIFNWTTYEYSKLIVISISNTLDLPNRLLPKIKSRMGNNKIMFKPYNKEELRIIIQDRGIDLSLFSEDAIRLSCVKVAAINGDLRRIFQILLRAKQINDLSNYKKKDKEKNLVSKYDILDAWNELFDSKISKVIKSLQINEKIIIASILSKTKENNTNKIKVGDLYDKIDIFLKKYNESNENNFNLVINWEEFKNSIYNLMRIKLINFYEMPKINFIENFVVIKFYTDEFTIALEEDEEFKPVLNYLTQMLNK
jgi:Cdc6-like AAA superfamily ATPase